MEWKMVSVTEHIDLDINNKFNRFKTAHFTVNGAMHTLRISMPDFGAGRTNDLVAKEAQLIMDALGKNKK